MSNPAPMTLDEIKTIPDPVMRAGALRGWQVRTQQMLAVDFRDERASTVRALREAGIPWVQITDWFGVSERHLRDEAERPAGATP